MPSMKLSAADITGIVGMIPTPSTPFCSLSLSATRSRRIGGAIRPGLAGVGYDRRS